MDDSGYSDVEFDRKLDALFLKYASASSDFVEVYHGNEWSIYKAFDFPQEGLITFITKGVSGYLLHRDGDPKHRVRQEFALSVDKKFTDYDAVPELNLIVDLTLEGRFRIAHHEVIDYAAFHKTVRPSQQLRFSKAIAAHPYWLYEVDNSIADDPYPMYVIEIIPLHEKEAKLAEDDIETFTKIVEAEKLDVLDLNRNSAV